MSQVEREDLENTKEIQNLDELREKAIDTLELEFLEVLDENREASTEEFIKEVEERNEELVQDEKPKEELQETKKKSAWKEKIVVWKEKWQNLPKQKKALILIGILILCILIGLGIYFLIPEKEEKKEEKGPDIIVNLDNYRYQNGTLIFLNSNKKEIGQYECQNKDQELCYVAYYSNEDNFDEEHNLYEDGTKIPRRSNIFLDRYVFISDNKSKEEELLSLYDIEEANIIDQYLLVKGYQNLENQVILKDSQNKYGLYRFTLEGLTKGIDFQYEYLGVMESKESPNRLISKNNNKWQLLDFDNKTVSKAFSNEIKNYNDHHITIKDNENHYHVVDYNNNELNEGNYEYIELLDNYILFIENQTLFVKDYENNKMNLEGISLASRDYIPTLIYTKENKLLETKKSFETSFQGAWMNIDIYNENQKETKQLNIQEGRISKDLVNMDYFDGTLYFYKDQEKKELLGNYTCKNKNQIDENTSELNNCKIATESFYQDNELEASKKDRLGTLPIYNERYIFITDNLDKNTNIILYDLKEKKELSKYRSVDAGAYTNTTNLTLVTTSNTPIMAENTNGKYGIFKISYDKVEGIDGLGFQFDHVERIGFHYLVQDQSGYRLINHEGKNPSGSVTNKIVKYNDKYMVTAKDNQYYLYHFDGSVIDNRGYQYIELYDDYYACVQNTNLKLYAYNDSEYDYFQKENFTLKRTNYSGSGTLAFRIIINQKKATVEIGLPNDSYDSKKIVLLEKTITPPIDDSDDERKETSSDEE